MLVLVFLLTLHVVLCALDGIIGILKCQHGVRVHEVGKVLVRFSPRRFVLADLRELVDVALAQACPHEVPQRRRALEVGCQCLAQAFELLIRLVDRASLLRVTRHARDDGGELLHHSSRQHVGHALVLVEDLAPDLYCRDLPRFTDPGAIVVVDRPTQNPGDLTVLKDTVKLGARRRLLLRVLKDGVV